MATQLLCGRLFSEMKYVNFRGYSLKNNAWLADVYRDDVTLPFRLLRENLEKRGISLNTPDINRGKNIDLELHINNHQKKYHKKQLCLLWEPAEIYKPNGLEILNKYYDRVYSWRDEYSERTTKFLLPINRPNSTSFEPFNSRSTMCVAISSNKISNAKSDNDLYAKRTDFYSWFNGNSPNDFALYGFGWDKPFPLNSRLRWLNRFPFKFSPLKRHAFENVYSGSVPNKGAIFRGSKYALTFENTANIGGYITEKIFDAMFVGCVPIYCGAPDIENYVPAECFIRIDPKTPASDVYKMMIEIEEEEYHKKQTAIREAIDCNLFSAFYAETFANFFTDEIEQLVNLKK